MKKYLIALMVVCLAGCASLGDSGSAKGKMEKLASTIKAKTLYVVVIPSANNIVSNQMVVMVMKAGGNNPHVDQLVALLTKPGGNPVGVTGDSDAVVAATIGAALKRIEKGKSTVALYYAGDESYIAELAEQAGQAGMTFKGIPYP
jgi:ABC-type uncharacterized transport system substrate-binding protein